MGQIPHGLGGYKNYSCRCETCKTANAEDIAAGIERRNAQTDRIPHGTPSGHTFWGCRCDDCRAADAIKTEKRRKSMNGKSLDRAHRHRQQWTGPELEIAMRGDLTAAQKARTLGRTVEAVRAAARLVRQEDPRFAFLAGLTENQELEV